MQRRATTPAKRNLPRLAVSATLAFALFSGCEPIRKTHGYVPADAYVARVQPGTDTRADVVEKIGRPSSSAMFQEDEWFYISRTTHTRYFFAPEAVDQQVLVVAFDANGVVSGIERYGLEDGQVVNLVTRTTPTRGKRLTFLQQLLGNFGRLSPEQITGDAPGF